MKIERAGRVGLHHRCALAYAAVAGNFRKARRNGILFFHMGVTVTLYPSGPQKCASFGRGQEMLDVSLV